MIVNQFTSNQRQLPEKVIELKGKSPLTASGSGKVAEQPSQVVPDVHLHSQSIEIAGRSQYRTQGLTTLVYVDSGFGAGHHSALSTGERGRAPVECGVVIRVANNDVENLSTSGPTKRRLQFRCSNADFIWTRVQNLFDCCRTERLTKFVSAAHFDSY